MRAFLFLILPLSGVVSTSFRFNPYRLSSITRVALATLRGGDQYDDDDRPRRPRPSTSSSKRPPPRDSYDRPPPSRRHPTRHRYRKPPPSALDTAASLAKKTVDLTTSAAWTTLKGSGKAAFYLMSPKHVTRQEVYGVWRLDQSVGTDSAQVCAANVEFAPRGEVVVKFEDEVFTTTYLFRERSWPQSCTIEFEARAFQGPNDEKPVLMRYKGYFRRKMADSSVIKIVGHIYLIQKKGLRRGDGRRIGSFVARRRLTKPRLRRPEEDDYEEEDDEFEEDFDDEESQETLGDRNEEDQFDQEEDDYDEWEEDEEEL